MKNKDRRISLGLLVFLASIVLIAVSCGGGPSTPTSAPVKLKVGALHVGSINDAGYNEAHHAGIEEMKKNLPNVEVIEAENIPESADAERVMENMIQQGAKLIFPASFGYLDPALNVAKRHPDVIFEHPGGLKRAPNLGTYWASTDAAFYLMGVAAGKVTKTNKLGFVGGFPIPNILYSVNGFTLGARSVNPAAETHVVFTGSWLDPAKEATATNALVDQGVDVVAMIVDSPITVVQTAEKRGIHSVGFHYLGVQKFAPKGWISGIGFTWGPLYTRFAQQVMNGTWKSEDLNGDISTDYLGIAPFGPDVSQDVQKLVMDTKQALIAGKMQIWKGPIKDSTGVERIKAGEVWGPDKLNTTDWLAEGVIGQTK